MKVKEVIELYLADREPHIASPETDRKSVV